LKVGFELNFVNFFVDLLHNIFNRGFRLILEIILSIFVIFEFVFIIGCFFFNWLGFISILIEFVKRWIRCLIFLFFFDVGLWNGLGALVIFNGLVKRFIDLFLHKFLVILFANFTFVFAQIVHRLTNLRFIHLLSIILSGLFVIYILVCNFLLVIVFVILLCILTSKGFIGKRVGFVFLLLQTRL